MESNAGGFWDDAKVISVYTRAQALADGVLVDVSELAREAGFQIPVALTRTLHDGPVTPPKSNKVEDVNGRLWDVLWMASLKIRRCPDGADRVLFPVILGRKTYELKAVVGGGDSGEPVITIMLPDED